MASLQPSPDPIKQDHSFEQPLSKSAVDPEKGLSPDHTNDSKGHQADCAHSGAKESVYKGLGWLDRLLALWILLAIVVGILMGNYVDGIEEALQKGKFVQVSVPIGQ